MFEPDKTHPKDWANPGRVRVLLKGKDGKLTDPDISNKHHLYILIAQHLKAHPTQKNTPFRLPIAGLPMPKEMPEPAVPKGWKMSKILPLHSPALTGGGVSENFMQDMMAEMMGAIDELGFQVLDMLETHPMGPDQVLGQIDFAFIRKGSALLKGFERSAGLA